MTASNVISLDAMPDAERQVRIDLAAAYRLVAMYGWDDMIFTHLSARVPGPEHHFLINPYGMMFDEITASSLVKIDLAGNPVGETPYKVNPAGFTIHSAVHEVREDAMCVMHVHTLDGTAVASTSRGLQPLNQTAQLIAGDLAYHDYEGVALDLDERPRLQRDLGEKNLMMLRNHGTLTCGATVATAFMRMYYLERACSMQVRTFAMGDAIYPTDVHVIEKNGDIGASPRGLMMVADRLAWPALLRKLDRVNPGYRD